MRPSIQPTMLCKYGKYHALKRKQCKCPQRSEDELYHESPKGTHQWNEIKWSDDDPHFARDSRTLHNCECECHKDDAKKLPFSKAFGRDYMSVVGVHAEGEPYDIVTGGIHLNDEVSDDIVKQQETLRGNDWYRSILLSEPRGRRGMKAVIVLPPTCPCIDKGIIFMKNDSCKPTHDSYPPISVTGLICATKVMLEYETEVRYEIGEEKCSMVWDTVAGPVKATGIVRTNEKESSCTAVEIKNVPSFVLELDHQVYCAAIGTVTVDIAFGGVFCAFVDASSLGLKIELGDVRKIAELGEVIKKAINASYVCSHPDLPLLKKVSSVVFTEPVFMRDGVKMMAMASVVSPGRLDRSPSGIATSARLAILHKRGEIGEEEFDEDLESLSVTGGIFSAAILGHTNIGEYDAVLTRVGGRARTISMKQVGVEEDDRYVEGYRLNDLWRRSDSEDPEEGLVGLGISFDGEKLKRWPDRNDLLGETY